MDAVCFDFMLPGYQERVEEAANYVTPSRNNRSPPPIREEKPELEVEESPGVSNEDKYEEQICSSSTVGESPGVSNEDKYEEQICSSSTVGAAEANLSDAVDNFSGKLGNHESGSNNSSTESFHDNSCRGHASIYHLTAISSSVKCDRNTPRQKRVAVLGRDFDLPQKIVFTFKMLVATEFVPPAEPPIKFVPFRADIPDLMRGIFYRREELLQHDLICLCYNASEARIMVMGKYGYYTAILRHIEAVLGKYWISIRLKLKLQLYV